MTFPGNLIVRADASNRIGTGHIMRCIALAQAWQNKGGTVVFLSHCRSNYIKQRIIDEGFGFVEIKNSYPHQDDLKTFSNYVSGISHKNKALFQDWVVVDGYLFDADYHKALKRLGLRLMVIDDNANLGHYHTDIILNQNINATNQIYSCDKNTLRLFGTEYALLRHEFLTYQNYVRSHTEKTRRILVTLGGADPYNITLKALRSLNLINDTDLDVKVIAGPENVNAEEIKSYLSKVSFNYEFFDSVSNVPELMAWANIAISAAGSTCWELCYMGLPAFLVIAADNQEDIGQKLEQYGAAINLGRYQFVTEKRIYESLNNLLFNSCLMRNMSEKGRLLVDGYGANRVIIKMINNIHIDENKSNLCFSKEGSH